MTITLSVLGTYATGVFNQAAAEESAYDPNSQRLFIVNNSSQAVDVLSLSDPSNPFLLFSIDVATFGPSPSSIAVSSTGLIAIAVEGLPPQEPGSVVFFDAAGEFLGSAPVGVTPNQLAFTPDGSRLLVANAGEPSADYTIDPEGSISIIDLSGGPAAAMVQTAGFGAFNAQQDTLSAAGVRIFGPGASVAQDLEPQSISISEDSLTAYITLQENNAVAVLDIATATVTEILPLGSKDHSLPGNELDPSDIDGGINIATAPVQGLYQPDAIASYTVNGVTYLVLANEGASRNLSGFSEEAIVGDLVLDPVAFPPATPPPPPIAPPLPPTTPPPTPTTPPADAPPGPPPAGTPNPAVSAQQVTEDLNNLTVSTVGADPDGDGDVDQLFAFGGRSFSIRDTAGNLIYDSGADFEQITAAAFPQFFNASNTANTFDIQSDDRGPEPNSVTVGQVGDRTYAFTSLEQIGGIMVYDVTDPTSVSFVQYINNRSFSGDPATGTAGDLGPEDLTFIAPEDSPTGGALLALPNAVSGTTTLYGIFNLVDDTTEVLINEIRTDQPGADTDQFFELLGTPNTSLNGLTYLVIGDGIVDSDGDGVLDIDGGSGVIEEVINLDGAALNGDGLFVAAENTFTLGQADLVTPLNFENDDNVTHLLVQNFTGSLNQDLDIDDDGVLDTIPWDETFDSVALVQSLLTGEKVYSDTVVGPDGFLVPKHVFRSPSGNEEIPPEPTPGNMPVGAMQVEDNPGTTPPATPPPEMDPPAADMPGTDMPGTDTPGTDMPGTDTPGTDMPGTDTPGTDMPGTDTPTETNPFQIGEFSPLLGTDTPGRPNDEMFGLTPIYDIQGAGHTSPLEGQVVITTGIVTGVAANGFYLQDAVGDGDTATSDGLFVFTNTLPNVLVGDQVNVQGTVSEFIPGGPTSGNLSTTQLVSSDLARISGGNPLPEATVLGGAGRIPPSEIIDDDQPTPYNIVTEDLEVYEPETDGIDFYESLEGMRVTVTTPQVVGATNRFGEIYTYAGGTTPTGLSDRGTLNISPTDFNPERIQIDPDSTISPEVAPLVDVGDTLSDVTGVVGYGFGNYEVIPTDSFTVVEGTLIDEVSTLAPTADQLTVASYNVLNLDPVVENAINVVDQDPDEVDDDVSDGRFAAIANDIVANLNTPDIIGLQEIQDNDGAEITNISSADLTFQTLIDAIVAAGGPTYEFIDTPGIVPASVDADGVLTRPTGGQPGGNIRVGFLYNPDRVSLVENSVVPLTDPADQAVNPDNPFFGSRIPLSATFLFNQQEVTVVNSHFSSKGGSSPLFGQVQPAVDLQDDPEAEVNGGLDERIAQAEAVQAFIAGLLTADPNANVVALGDFNEFEFLPPLDILEQDLTNLTDTLAENERYSFIFQGNSQSLDHILVSDSLDDAAEFDIVHVNTEFAETPTRASDHDPLLARVTVAAPVAPPAVEQPEVVPPLTPPDSDDGVTDIIPDDGGSLGADPSSGVPVLAPDPLISEGTLGAVTDSSLGAEQPLF